MKTPMAKLMLAAFAAISLGANAEITNTVKVTKFHQSYPYSGKAMVEYTVGGTLPANAIAEFKIDTDDASATFVQSNIVAGANTHVIDFASSFGGALLLTNASFVVTIAEGAGGGSSGGLGGVQLWEGGPYWAECNVGASKPEEYGYYFWWGDTVGYRREGDAWVASDGSAGNFSFSSGNTPTYGKNNATLQSEGWITAEGALAPEHDAAQVHWGGGWRMPTDSDIDALINNCDWTWTTRNCVVGCEVRGKGDYASASIFLPAAGFGYETSLNYFGSYGGHWSSTPYSSNSANAWYLGFDSGHFIPGNYYRYRGQSVRALRGFAE